MAPSNLTKRVDVAAAHPAVPARAADAALAERCRQGELQAFEELYRQHAPRLFSLAARMLGNLADAEDALQDTFLLAHRRMDSYRGEAALGTWLYRLAVNQCLDRLRSRAAREAQATDSYDEPDRFWQPSARPHVTNAEHCPSSWFVAPVEGVELRVAVVVLERDRPR